MCIDSYKVVFDSIMCTIKHVDATFGPGIIIPEVRSSAMLLVDLVVDIDSLMFNKHRPKRKKENKKEQSYIRSNSGSMTGLPCNAQATQSRTHTRPYTYSIYNHAFA